jgi:PhnB protein
MTNQMLTPYLTVKGAAAAIEFYQDAFGATPSGDRYDNPDGTVGHAELSFGEGLALYLSDEAPGLDVLAPPTRGGATSSLVLEVDDADAAFERAVAAGAAIDRPLTNEPYGRSGWLVDPFGHRWCINGPAR